MPISTINQNGLNAPLTLTSPVFSGNVTATTITSPAATALTLQSAGTTAVTIDTSQNVGIGTASPGSILELKAATPILRINGTSQASARGIVFQDNGTTRASLTHNSDSGSTALSSGDAGNGYFLAFRTDNAERMRITSGGDLYIGGTTGTYGSRLTLFSGGGGNVIESRQTGSGAQYHVIYMNSNGAVGSIQTSGSSTSYVTSSDYRLKENIAPMTGALATVAQLKPCTYTWKVDGSNGQGFIAHELQAVVPDCVTGEKDAVDADGKPVYQGVDASFLVATLTAAIQELKAEFDAYKASHP